MTDARTEILARIRSALDDRGKPVAPTLHTPDSRESSATAAPTDRPPAHAVGSAAPTPGSADRSTAPTAGSAAPADRSAAGSAAPADRSAVPLPDHFAARVADYKATVARAAGDAEVRSLVADVCSRHEARRIAVPEGVPDAWIPEDIEVVAVTGAPDIAALDAVDGVLTTCATAIAETGTIVLDGGPGQGPRAATLLPDLHICVVPGDRIVAGVPEAIDHLAADPGRPVTFISGPSATSDIELDRVEGVHGPRRLEVIVVGPS